MGRTPTIVFDSNGAPMLGDAAREELEKRVNSRLGSAPSSAPGSGFIGGTGGAVSDADRQQIIEATIAAMEEAWDESRHGLMIRQHEMAVDQSNWQFRSGLATSIAGFILIAFAVWAVIQQGPAAGTAGAAIDKAWLAGIAGVVLEVISALFFNQTAKARAQANYYMAMLFTSDLAAQIADSDVRNATMSSLCTYYCDGVVPDPIAAAKAAKATRAKSKAKQTKPKPEPATQASS